MDVGIYPALWISMILGAEPKKVTAHGTLTETGVDSNTFVTMEYEGGALGLLQTGFTACLPNDVTIVGETGIIRVRGPPQAPSDTSGVEA